VVVPQVNDPHPAPKPQKIKNQFFNEEFSMKSILHIALLGSLLATSLTAIADKHDLIEGNEAYAVDSRGHVAHNNFGDCWRTSAWTKELAIKECDPDLFPEQAAAPEPAPTPTPAPAPAPTKVEKTKSLDATALFGFDKDTLSDSGRMALDELADDLNRMDSIDNVTVVGHTDSTGPAEYNMGLSERRANTVRSYLVDKGITADKVTAKGMGETQPTASNDTDAGRSQNRRVEVIIKGSEIVIVR
jgi:OOP family OmpA-OmpF porin